MVDVALAVTVVSIGFLVVVAAIVSYLAFAGPSRTGRDERGASSTD